MTNLNGYRKRVDQLASGAPVKLEVVNKVDQVGQPVATVLIWNGRIVKAIAPNLWDAI